jgi:hypothetical protein
MEHQRREGRVSAFNRTIALVGAIASLGFLAGCGVDMNAPVLSASADVTQTPSATPTKAPTAAAVVSTATPVPVSASASTPVAQSTAIAGDTTSDPSKFQVTVKLDASQTHPISPLIYGIADRTSGNSDTIEWLGATMSRWGGSFSSRYNWETNDSNAGQGGRFKNVKQGDDTPGSASLGFFNRNAKLGLAGILTIPTLGWVAKDGESQSKDVPQHGGPAIEKGSDAAFTEFTDGTWRKPYDPAANRALTSVQSFASKGAPFAYPPDLNDGKVYQDEWVAYLKATRDKSAQPAIYAMDNEPELWADNTHVDVHPARLGYDDQLANFLEYARAVKKADPDGLVAGPESWGLTGYMYSALDEGGDQFQKAADRAAHGDTVWIEWFLRSVAESDKQAGSRSLDVLTLHYYPSGGEYLGGNDPATQAQRVQEPRGLWDGLYTVPGWVGKTEWGNLALLNRMKDFIDANYPGTKLGLTEWNFGGADDISGAIATADALGIFGREGLYLASYAGEPDKNSATGWAFRMYRNYDGKGGQFGSRSVQTVSSDTEMFSAYGALDEKGTKMTVMLINKDPKRSSDVTLQTTGFTASEMGDQYRYDGTRPDGPDSRMFVVPDPKSVTVTVPPMSISLVELNGTQK